MLIFAEKEMYIDEIKSIFDVEDRDIVEIDFSNLEQDEIQKLINQEINNTITNLYISYKINDFKTNELINYYVERKDHLFINILEYGQNFNNKYLNLFIGKLYSIHQLYNDYISNNILSHKHSLLTNKEELNSFVIAFAQSYQKNRSKMIDFIENKIINKILFIEGINDIISPKMSYIDSIKKIIDKNTKEFHPINTYNLFQINADNLNKFSFSTFYDDEDY